ncbi:GCC2 and GCC3 domain containing [Chlorella sorokiniana]|uniref:GCC2 and GCC3 domain containing n=1 Tax=Chlorella sorokiniana TaxID=3076 RepID=A0A2P6THM1_CHLSO|nr:GCC2 and GCC3 domain containing [Chlorella sorokiniana]|eukprot:PRW33791.1 GCC2 and GCC3 domain containing [Chlorella sorokiniana]
MAHRALACALAVLMLALPSHARVGSPRATLSTPTKSVVVDPVGLKATERLLTILYTATRPRMAGGDQGGEAADVQNAKGLHRHAGDLLESLGKVKTSLLARAPIVVGASGGRAPLVGRPVSSSDQQFANGVADLLTAPGASAALRITGTPPEWEAKESRDKLCNDAKQTGMSAQARDCVCSPNTPWAVCSAMIFKEGQGVQAEQAAQPIDWSAPEPAAAGRRLQGAAAASSQATWLEPTQLGGVMESFAASAQEGHARGLLAKKTKCKFNDILGIFTDRCGGFSCAFPLPPPPGALMNLKLSVDACLPVVSIGPNLMKLCTAGNNAACVDYSEATYAAAQAATQLADTSKASITAQLCLKLGKLKKVVKWLGLDGICAGPTISWWPIKEQVQLAQGVSALVARLDVGGLLHYGNSTENSMCNFFREARSQDAWNWHMKCQDFCAWKFGSGKIDVSFTLNLIFWQETWTWPVVESSKPACDPAPQQCAPGQFTNHAAGDACTSCPAGTWSNALRTFACNQCPAGTYSTWTGALLESTCKKCPQGQYAPSPGSSQCQPCPLGSFNPYEGAAACINCPAGTYGIAAGTKSKDAGCRNAPPGHYVATDGQTSPVPCPKGNVQPLEGQTYCTKCPIEGGAVSENPGGTRCVPCPIATFQLTSERCIQCYAGRYQDEPGAPGMPPEKRCKPCAPGSYCSNRGCTSCTPCPAGTFMERAGVAQCTACAAGTVSLTPGATSCVQCPAGKRYVNATTCEPCPAGTFGQPDGLSCKACSKGTYQSSTGATKCLDCPLATISNTDGAAQCTKCPDGQFSWVDMPKEYTNYEQPRTVCHATCPANWLLKTQNGMRRCCKLRRVALAGGLGRMSPLSEALPGTSVPLATIDALPDALLAHVLVQAGRKRCPITLAVCRRWRRLVFGEPRLWRSVTLSPGLLPQLAKKKDKQRWFSSQHGLLRRIAPLVEAAAVEGGTAIEAAGAATGKWGLADLLSALHASKLAELSIQGPWELPAAALRALGRLTGLTWLKLDSTELPGEELLAALGQLAALQTLELSTDELPWGLPDTLAQLSRLRQLRCDIAEPPMDIGDLFTLPRSLTSIQLGVRNDGVVLMTSPAQLPELQHFFLQTAGWFADCCRNPCAGRLLHTLDLSNNSLQRLPRVLASATSLTSLLLGGNPGLIISMEDIDSILAALPSLASLTVRRAALSPEVAQHIEAVLPGLAVVEETVEAGPEAYQPPPHSEASGSSDEEGEL